MRMTGVVAAGGRGVVGACLVVAMASGVFVGTAQAVGVTGQGTWETTLQGRDLDGNAANGYEAYYDTALNISWLADANYALNGGYDADGYMTWDVAQTWVANLNVNGIMDWRLPSMVDTGTPGCNFAFNGTDCGWNVDTSTSELVHLYDVTLGNKAYYDTTGNGPQGNWGLINTGPFKDVPFSIYWYGEEYAPYAGAAWFFDITGGYQRAGNKDFYEYVAWAVHPGDVGIAAVPEPASYALALAGLAVAGVARRRRDVDVLARQGRISP